ncbi:MAG: hypothetical protein ACRDJC_20695 [Thermomicrobiales bacterium]
MTNDRWDSLVRATEEIAPGRRGLLATLLALGAAGVTGNPTFVAAGKKKRKRCKKKKCPRPPTCGDLCGANCNFCYSRTAGSPLCSDIAFFSMTCTPCETDNQCLGTNFPYCLSSRLELAAGLVQEISCQGSPPGACGNPIPCA